MAERVIAAAVGFVGGGVASLILLGLMVSIFDLSFHSVLQGALVGAFICSVVGFCFPKLGVILIEFVG